ncbi:MAG TPA: roadblock/LC7 domain-containing protein [Chloroflexia bacterium]|nr:roadblock/LC7 domain-containing protein [Chloroflexia bacterium]
MSAIASKTDLLNDVLDSLAVSLSGDVNGSAVVSLDGIVYASRFPSGISVDRVGAIAATTLGVSKRVAKDLTMGNTSESIIQCDNGYFIILPVNEKCLLAVNLRKGGNLGMTRLEAGDAATRIAAIMS